MKAIFNGPVTSDGVGKMLSIISDTADVIARLAAVTLYFNALLLDFLILALSC